MKNKNLLEINSPNIKTVYSIFEYQRMYLNDNIGEVLKNLEARVQESFELQIVCEFEDIFQKIDKEFLTYRTREFEFYIVEDDFISNFYFINIETKNCIASNILSSSTDKCKKYIQKIKELLKDFIKEKEDLRCVLLQYLNGELDYSHTIIKTNFDFEPLSFPFIKNIDRYIDTYLSSDAPILLLYGEPGTGKTTFTRYLLNRVKEKEVKQNSNFKVAYSFDETIFQSNDFYNTYLTDNFDFYVLEDINIVLLKNEDDFEYNYLDKLASVTDGLLSNNKKIIISTNIENLYQINDKIIRPGRCFDTLKFRSLNNKELEKLVNKYQVKLDDDINSLNISEFFARLKKS